MASGIRSLVRSADRAFNKAVKESRVRNPPYRAPLVDPRSLTNFFGDITEWQSMDPSPVPPGLRQHPSLVARQNAPRRIITRGPAREDMVPSLDLFPPQAVGPGRENMLPEYQPPSESIYSVLNGNPTAIQDVVDASPARPPPPIPIEEDRASRERRYEEPVWNLNPDPVAAAGQPQVPQFLKDTVNPWVDLAKSGYGAVSDIASRYLVDPNADPNLQPTPANALAPDPTVQPELLPEGPPPTFTPGVTAGMRTTPPQPLPGRLSEEYVDPSEVLPPDPAESAATEQPAVVPRGPLEPPDLDTSGLPGTTTETATGGLSLEQFIDQMKTAYPDIDWSNPKQAEADANARRDLDRTAMLAQLQLAAGITKGAGVQWEGIGQGFEGAAGAYDKGFQKYQQALQDSADRYQKQRESQITYDTARRQAALELYTNEQNAIREDRRTVWTERNKREWDIYKIGVEGDREGRKQSETNIRDFFTKALKPLEPASDPSTADPVEEERKARLRSQTLAAMQESLLRGEIVMPGEEDVDVSD